MKQKGHVIKEVVAGSIAEEMELVPGDRLISINGKTIEDIFDYQYLAEDEFLDLVVENENGEEWELEIEKDEDEDIGLIFEHGLMDDYRSCTNNCVFCFIDQMPPGMRETLYFKDDDSRLSFLQGNYITLTNMKQRDIDRIIRFNWSPINISIQTMNPELRCKMLDNRFAGKVLSYLNQLSEAGITMNGQIVLCPGLNDGEELDRTIRELSAYLPHMQSVSVVPVGLTKFREGLFPLKAFRKKDAVSALEIIDKWRKTLYKQHGNHFVHASDEFYLMAERQLPAEDEYDGYPQLENGVGMLRLLMEETGTAVGVIKDLENPPCQDNPRKISIATGRLASPTIELLLNQVKSAFPWIDGRVYTIENRFFGDMITVSGLLTGQDLLAQLKGEELGECLLLPENMLRSGERVFLDDMTVEELERELNTPVVIVRSCGDALVNALLGIEDDADESVFRPYELDDEI